MKRPAVGDRVRVPLPFGYLDATVVDVFGGVDGYVTVEIPVQDAWGKTVDTELQTLPIAELKPAGDEATARPLPSG